MTYPAEVRLYAAQLDTSTEIASQILNAHPEFSETTNRKATADRLLSCHRATMAEEVAPLLEALQLIADTPNCMEGEDLTAELIENAHDEMITKARQTIAAWEKDHAG